MMERDGRARMGVSFGVGLSLVAGLASGCAVFSEQVDPVPLVQECSIPSTEDVQQVTSLLSIPPSTTDVQHRQKRETQAAFDARRAQVGSKFHVTLPSLRLEQEDEALDINTVPFAAVFSKTHDFLQEFHIDLALAKSGDEGIQPNQIPTQADLETKTAKYETQEIVKSFLALPEEFFALSGTKRIILAKDTDDVAHANRNAVVINIKALDEDPTLTAHEVTHEIDAAECGDRAGDDPTYEALNGHDIYNEATRANEITLSGKTTTDTNMLIYEQRVPTYKSLECQQINLIKQDEAHVVAYSDYGLTNVVEDKAEVGKNIAFPDFYGDMLDPSMPVLRYKFLTLMTRLYQLNPNIVRYLATLGNRERVAAARPVEGC